MGYYEMLTDARLYGIDEARACTIPDERLSRDGVPLVPYVGYQESKSITL